MTDLIYLEPREMFDPAIITEGFRVIYCYNQLLEILTRDYESIILDTPKYRGATLTTIESKARSQARQWLLHIRESAHFAHHKAPVIAHICIKCKTPIVGSINLCPATEYKYDCVVANTI